ncbi:discoidin domain-containing protein [Neobacillus drentensis]|uniref:discoidin domain-containing protein n=1 Tax=Neobacillus drentensis TaxID=220684 RepID=UPI002FFDA3F9
MFSPNRSLNLGGTYAIDKVAYLPRPSGSNGNITGYNVYVSTDGFTPLDEMI